MKREICVDVGGGNGDFYKRGLSHSFSILSRLSKNHIVLDPRAQNKTEGGIRFIHGGISSEERLPFPDSSVAHIDANFIIPHDDLSRFTVLVAEAKRVLQPKGEVYICDYDKVVTKLMNILPLNDFQITEPRLPKLGERSHQVDYFLIGTGAVSLEEATEYGNDFQDETILGMMTSILLSGDLSPEKIKQHREFIPKIFSIKKIA